KGWDGGQAWLNGQTLLFRQNLALALSSRANQYVKTPVEGLIAEPADLLRKHGKSDDAAIVDFLLDLFMQHDVPVESREKLVDYLAHAHKLPLPGYWSDDEKLRHPTRAVTHLVLTLPEYQLN